MKTWLMTLLACSLAVGCIEDAGNSTPDSGVVEPEPSPPEPEPEAQPEPQPEGQPEPQPEPQPEGQPEPQPEPQPEGQPEPQPEPQPEGQPEPQPEPQPEGQPEPQPEPQPDAPEPEPIGPVNNCADACAQVDQCFTRNCGAEAGATAALCGQFCADQAEVVIGVVAGAESCADLIEVVRAAAPEAAALCPDEPQPEPEPEGPIGDCAATCDVIDQCLSSECGAEPGTFRAECNVACAEFGDALNQLVASADGCGELIDVLQGVSPEVEAICEGEPQPEPEPEPLANCAEACDRVATCYAQECRPLSAEQRAVCDEGCREAEGPLLAIIDGRTCAEVVDVLNGLAPELAPLCEDRLTCDVVCDRILRDCVGNPGDNDERAACVAGCNEANPIQAQLECAFTAECDAIEFCEEVEPPPPVGIEGDCARACATVFDCGIDGAPPGADRDVFIAQCTPACVEESTAEERDCVLDANGCEAIDMCFAEQ